MAPSVAREAYATLVYGDTPAACAAAVLGVTLRRHDPSRERVAIVRDLSNRTREVLTHNGLWRLHEARVNTQEGRRSVGHVYPTEFVFFIPFFRLLMV